MDKFSSRTNLIFHGNESSVAARPMQVLKTRRGSLNQTKKETDGTCNRACLVFVKFAAFGFIAVNLCIVVVYIGKLHVQLEALEERVRSIEEKTTERCICEKESSGHKEGETGDRIRSKEVPPDLKWRKRRAIIEESEHIHTEHHGISSAHIAMIFGSQEKLSRTLKTDEVQEKFQFTADNVNRTKGDICDTRYTRGDDQAWCTPTKRSGRRVHRYMTSKYNQLYRYFEEAKWMKSLRTLRNYNLTLDGKIIVYKAGIYIVHASVHFTDVGENTFPNFGVYKTDDQGYSEKLISMCTLSVNTAIRRRTGVYPCQAWQLAHLQAGDRVFLSIGGYTWFRIEPETFHLALIQLNEEDL